MATLEEAVTRSLQCPICLELLTEPTLLRCFHTFCTPCVTLLYNSRGDDKTLFCPICRETTVVEDGDLSKLKPNLYIKGLVNDVADAQHFCTQCDSELEDRSPAKTYCQDCKTYMCADCHRLHAKWKASETHQTYTLDEVKQGKVVLKKKLFCLHHEPEEGEHECTDVCLTCSKIICIRCRVLYHEKEGHDVLGAGKYTENMNDQIKNLQRRVAIRSSSFKEQIAFIVQQKKRVTDHVDKQKLEIEMIHQEYVRRLNERKDILLMQCDTEKDELLVKLDNVKADAERTVESIESARDLARNTLKAPLGGDIVAIRQFLVSEVDEVVDRDDAYYKDVAVVTGRAEKFEFEQNKDENKLELGRVMYTEWKLKTEVKLSVENRMNATCGTPDGRIAVGNYTGGIEIYNFDGQMQETVQKDVNILGLGVLSDGRYVVIDGNNTLSLYTSRWEKHDVTFRTLSKDEGGISNVTVDSDDRIYVSYRKAKKIQVFTLAGGAAVREIQCVGYEPRQIFALKPKNVLIVKSKYEVRVIDADSGAVKHEVSKQGVYPFPAVRHDDSIIIAWVNHNEGFVTIDQYTSELDHVTTLIADQNINKSKERDWYYLQEFLSGEIVLCTTDKLYIFHIMFITSY